MVKERRGNESMVDGAVEKGAVPTRSKCMGKSGRGGSFPALHAGKLDSKKNFEWLLVGSVVKARLKINKGNKNFQKGSFFFFDRRSGGSKPPPGLPLSHLWARRTCTRG